MIIYMAVNKINNKKYIGQTVQRLCERKCRHLGDVKRSKLPFHRAIRKYGAEGFEWKIIYHAKSIEELNAMETYYINAYATHVRENGYNIAMGGGNRRIPISVRKKISAANTGEKNHNFGKIFGKIFSAENNPMAGKIGNKNHRYGKKHIIETLQKMSVKQKGSNNPRFDPKIYTFHHQKYGIVSCTQYALREEFSLRKGFLSKLITGEQKSTKGWRIASPEYIQEIRGLYAI